MKKTILLSAMALLTIQQVSAQSNPNNTIGLLYDAGGKFDKSFNQSAYEGGQRVAKNLGMTVLEYEGKVGEKESSINAGLNSLISRGSGLTFGVGFNNNTRITNAANANPNLKFALIDDVSPAANVASLLFKEEEGSFLAGYIAAQATSTGRIGFVGGMPIPLIKKFAAGYKAGASMSGKTLNFQSVYVGTTDEAWSNDKRAGEIANNLMKTGVDVIFAAAGSAGNGVINAVNTKHCLKSSELPAGVKFSHDNYKNVPKSASYKAKCAGDTRPVFFIGVDSNQNYLGDEDNNPNTLNHGLTSMIKRVDVAVYTVSNQFKQNKFKGGEQRFGLKEGGISYAIDQYNKPLMTPTILSRVEKLKFRIIRGLTKVANK